ncbi:MAG: exosortase N [Flavobacteriales bacterium]|nr:exosortase N [Flavobacteriales bacterium]
MKSLLKSKISIYSLASIIFILFLLKIRSFIYHDSFISALVFLPFIFRYKKMEKTNYITLFILVVSIAASWYFQRRSLVYLSLFSWLIFGFNTFRLQINKLTWFWILFSSPAFLYGSKIFSFPLRLKLTEMAGNVFQNLGMNVLVDGNEIQINGNAFLVDPACAGLHFWTIGFMVLLALLSWKEKKNNQEYNLWKIIFFVGITAILSVFSNFFRILSLVITQYPENSFGHEAVGLASFLIYLVIPLAFIISKIKVNHQEILKKQTFQIPKKLSLKMIFTVAFFGGIIYSLPVYFEEKNPLTKETIPIQLDRYKFVNEKNMVFQFQNESSLLYIKPCLSAFGSCHNPTICWKGSGYQFSNEKVHQLEDHRSIYWAKLIKEKEQLYTAWWYTDGVYHTVDQFGWRSRGVQSEKPFMLVNITAESKEELFQQIRVLRYQ